MGPSAPSTPTLIEAPKGFQCIFHSALLTHWHDLHFHSSAALSWWLVSLRHHFLCLELQSWTADYCIVAFILDLSEKKSLSYTHTVLYHWKIGSPVTNVTLLLYLFETLSFAVWCPSTFNHHLLFSFQFAFVTFFHFLSCRKGLLLWQLFCDSPFRLHETHSHTDQTAPNCAVVFAAAMYTGQYPLTMEVTTMHAE